MVLVEESEYVGVGETVLVGEWVKRRCMPTRAFHSPILAVNSTADALGRSSFGKKLEG